VDAGAAPASLHRIGLSIGADPPLDKIISID
jgi:hypothetical protein